MPQICFYRQSGLLEKNSTFFFLPQKKLRTIILASTFERITLLVLVINARLSENMFQTVITHLRFDEKKSDKPMTDGFTFPLEQVDTVNIQQRCEVAARAKLGTV